MIAATIDRRLADWPNRAPPSQELLVRDASGLSPPDHRSANRQCQLLQAGDGWIAINLARPEDRELIPPLTRRAGDPWHGLAEWSRDQTCAALRDAAAELQLPVAVVGEAAGHPLCAVAAGSIPRRVIDLSALWAGPLCGSLLAWAGAEVVRIESVARPDPTAITSPALDRFLNGRKTPLALDLRRSEARDRLIGEIAEADALITSARPAALARLGLTPDSLFTANPALIWAAITAHGWTGPGSLRVGFGDDCAAAGGLIDWTGERPRFCGDAIADPLTGIEAALAVRAAPPGELLDLAMARIASGYALARQAIKQAE